MTSVIRIYLLCLQTVLIAARPGAQYKMLVSNIFTVNFMFCPSKANSWRFKSMSCNRNEPLTIHKHMANYRRVKIYKTTRGQIKKKSKKKRKIYKTTAETTQTFDL